MYADENGNLENMEALTEERLMAGAQKRYEQMIPEQKAELAENAEKWSLDTPEGEVALGAMGAVGEEMKLAEVAKLKEEQFWRDVQEVEAMANEGLRPIDKVVERGEADNKAA